MPQTSYQGWFNRPTWAVNLRISNDRVLKDRMVNWFRMCAVSGISLDDAVYEVAEKLEEYVWELYEEASAEVDPIVSDALLLTPSDAEIHCIQIARNFMSPARYEQIASESIRSTVSGAYNKGKNAAKNGVAKTKQAASKAKPKTAPKSKSTKSKTRSAPRRR